MSILIKVVVWAFGDRTYQLPASVVLVGGGRGRWDPDPAIARLSRRCGCTKTWHKTPTTFFVSWHKTTDVQVCFVSEQNTRDSSGLEKIQSNTAHFGLWHGPRRAASGPETFQAASSLLVAAMDECG